MRLSEETAQYLCGASFSFIHLYPRFQQLPHRQYRHFLIKSNTHGFLSSYIPSFFKHGAILVRQRKRQTEKNVSRARTKSDQSSVVPIKRYAPAYFFFRVRHGRSYYRSYLFQFCPRFLWCAGNVAINIFCRIVFHFFKNVCNPQISTAQALITVGFVIVESLPHNRPRAGTGVGARYQSLCPKFFNPSFAFFKNFPNWRSLVRFSASSISAYSASFLRLT